LWRSFGGDYPHTNGVDQIARLIKEIETNPNSRRLIVTGWNPETCDEVALPPCHTLFQFKIERSEPPASAGGQIGGRGRPRSQGTLNCQLYQRSADAFLGVPFNISSYALLTHLVAHVCDLEVGDFIHTFGDLHIYSNHFDQVNEVLSREPLALPALHFAGADSLKGLEGLLDFKFENLKLENYQSYGKIAAPVAV
jgi:thymidylate synthase